MKKTFSKLLIIGYVLFFILIPIKTNAAIFDSNVEENNSIYIVPYGREIGVKYEDNETLTSNNENICKVESAGKLQIVGVGKVTLTSKKGGEEKQFDFFAWNVCLKKDGYTVFSDVNKTKSAGEVYGKTYFAISKTSVEKSFKIEEHLFITGRYTGKDLNGKYLTSHYNEINDSSDVNNFVYALDNKFDQDDDGTQGGNDPQEGDDEGTYDAKIKLGDTYTPKSEGSLTWVVENEDILKIEDAAKGKVRGIRVGTTTLTGKSGNTKKVELKIRVYREKGQTIDVQRIELDKTKVELSKSEVKTKPEEYRLTDKEKINATVVPSYADNRKVTWTTSNRTVASVSNQGRIKPVSAGEATITASTSNGAMSTCVVTVKPDITVQTFDQRNKAVIEYFNDSSRNISSIFKKYCKNGSIKGYQPALYETNISGDITLYNYNENTLEKTNQKTVNKNTLSYYMTPGNTYCLESADKSKTEYVKITGEKRMIYAPGVYNVRDLGGMKADGGTLKYGKVFRGANPNNIKDENVFKHLGIKLIVDLRSASDFKKASSHFKFAEKVNNPPGYYLHSGNPRNAIRSIMKGAIANKNVFFHCAVGTDRTGTVAYLTEGLLGVPLEDRLDDYELSYFYRELSGHGSTRSKVRNGSLYKKVDKYSTNNKEQEKFMNWFLDGSSNKESDLQLINNFRKAMIEGNPTTYTLSNGKVKEM